MLKHLGISISLIALLGGCTGEKPSPATTGTPIPTATPAQVSVTTPSATPQSKAETEPYLIVPGKSVGTITQQSTIDSLKQAFGPENVVKEDIYVGEGFSLPGLVINPKDETKRVEIVFEEENPTKIQMIRVEGKSSVWKTAEGVTVGIPATKLQELNGKPFEMSGLGWDLGGWVTNWQGGKLEGLNVRLEYVPNVDLTEQDLQEIMGDQIVKSDNPSLIKADPNVYQITVGF